MSNILIIEDDATVLAYLKFLIKKKFGSSIYTANNGEDGLKLLAEVAPDIILLDLYMPGMGGVEFLELLRKNEKFAKTPVLIISSEKDSEIITKLIGLGITDYILKPVNPGITYERLGKVIKQISNNK